MTPDPSPTSRALKLVIATPDTFAARQMIETARPLNPSIEVVVRTHNAEEAELLHREHAGKTFISEYELAFAMTHYVLDRASGRAERAVGDRNS